MVTNCRLFLFLQHSIGALVGRYYRYFTKSINIILIMKSTNKLLTGFGLVTSVAALVALVVKKEMDFGHELSLTNSELEQDLLS